MCQNSNRFERKDIEGTLNQYSYEQLRELAEDAKKQLESDQAALTQAKVDVAASQDTVEYLEHVISLHNSLIMQKVMEQNYVQ